MKKVQKIEAVLKLNRAEYKTKYFLDGGTLYNENMIPIKKNISLEEALKSLEKAFLILWKVKPEIKVRVCKGRGRRK